MTFGSARTAQRDAGGDGRLDNAAGIGMAATYEKINCLGNNFSTAVMWHSYMCSSEQPQKGWMAHLQLQKIIDWHMKTPLCGLGHNAKLEASHLGGFSARKATLSFGEHVFVDGDMLDVLP